MFGFTKSLGECIQHLSEFLQFGAYNERVCAGENLHQRHEARPDLRLGWHPVECLHECEAGDVFWLKVVGFRFLHDQYGLNGGVLLPLYQT